MKTLKRINLTIILISLLVKVGFSQSTNAFRFRITGNGFSDETIIRLVHDATPNFDGNYDAWKVFSRNQNVPSIYTEISPGKEMSINALPIFTNDHSITIFTNIPANGTYTIEFEEIFKLDSNYQISFTNINSKTHYRLSSDTAFTFNMNAQQNAPTFTFNISTPLSFYTVNETCSNSNDGSLTLTNAGNLDWNATIMDSNSNVVINSDYTSLSHSFLNLLPGTYTGKVTSNGITDEFSFKILPAIQLLANFDLTEDTIYLDEGAEINPINNSLNGLEYNWEFGDGGSSSNENPLYNYSITGENVVELEIINGNCYSVSSKIITILSSRDLTTSIQSNNIEPFKIATLGNGNFKIFGNESTNNSIIVHNLNGTVVHTASYSNSIYQFSLSNQPSGLYIITISQENGEIHSYRVVK